MRKLKMRRDFPHGIQSGSLPTRYRLPAFYPLIAFILLLFVVSAQAQKVHAANDIAVDASSTTKGSGVSSLTWSHTVSGSNRLLIVGVSTRKNNQVTISGITYSGT